MKINDICDTSCAGESSSRHLLVRDGNCTADSATEDTKVLNGDLITGY